MVSVAKSMCCDVVANTRFAPLDNDGDPLVNRMIEQRDHGMFQASMGSTNHTKSMYLVSDDEEDENLTSPADNVETSDDYSLQKVADYLFDQSDSGNIDLDDAFISAATASIPQDITASQLSKMWCIDIPTAEKTLELTTQRVSRPPNEQLRCNYGTTDCML